MPSKAEESKAAAEQAQLRMSEIDLNVLIKFIGTFDGSRDTLIPFLNNCRNAINLASSSQQDILFKYILSRLTGKAESVCAIKEFTKWSQLEEFLKDQFGDRKHYAHLLAELQSCKQLPNENVSQYSLKVESCLSKLVTEINISIPTRKKDELSGRLATMQDLALNRFMMGLDPRLATIIRCRDPTTLNEAINFAIAEEKILGVTYKRNPFPSNQSNNTYRPNYSNPTYSRPQGQTSQSRPQGQSYVARPQGPGNFTNSQAPMCRYCKNMGHTIENCRKRQYNNSRRENYDSRTGGYRNGNNPPNGNFNRTVHHTTHDNIETICECTQDGHDTVDNNLNE